jgi:hypothetical protein
MDVNGDLQQSIVQGLTGIMQSESMSFVMEVPNPMNQTRQRFCYKYVFITAKAYLKKASKGPLEGSNIRFEYKKVEYPVLGPRFKPLVVESTGGCHPCLLII